MSKYRRSCRSLDPVKVVMTSLDFTVDLFQKITSQWQIPILLYI